MQKITNTAAIPLSEIVAVFKNGQKDKPSITAEPIFLVYVFPPSLRGIEEILVDDPIHQTPFKAAWCA